MVTVLATTILSRRTYGPCFGLNYYTKCRGISLAFVTAAVDHEVRSICQSGAHKKSTHSSGFKPYSTTGGASPAALVHTTVMPVGLP